MVDSLVSHLFDFIQLIPPFYSVTSCCCWTTCSLLLCHFAVSYIPRTSTVFKQINFIFIDFESRHIQRFHRSAVSLSWPVWTVEQHRLEVIFALHFHQSVTIRWKTISLLFQGMSAVTLTLIQFIERRKGRGQRRRQSMYKHEGFIRVLKLTHIKYIYDEKKHDENQKIFDIKSKWIS